MKYAVDKKDNFTQFDLMEEKFDTIVAPEIKSKFITLNAEGNKNIILNLETVKYVDSSGLSAILVANRLCQGAEGRLVLSNVSDHVMKLFKISQLDSVLNIAASVDEAKAGF